MKKYAILASVLTLVTSAFAGELFASWFWLYQPETPKCLNK